MQNKLYIKENFECNNFLISTDEKLLKEILDNLLNNALRFTLNGGITLALKRTETEIIIQVADTGIGIPSNKLHTIFEEFRQVSEGKGRNFEGTGLGLTIAKKYTTLLGGTIEVESEIGVGTTFSLAFPITSQIVEITENDETNTNIESPVIPKIQGSKPVYNILLVEDDYVNSFAIQEMLSNNYSVYSVFNGDDAIKTCGSKNFDLILMDINLKKGKNGIETAQEIRKFVNYKNIPIVAMTAYAMNEDKNEFINSGFSHYLSKPFSSEALINLIKSILT